MLLMPFFGDQFSNSIKITEMGGGLYLDHRILNENELIATIYEVITDPKWVSRVMKGRTVIFLIYIFTYRYKVSINEIADLVEDQQISGLDRIMWWTEYLLKHKNVEHLKNPSLGVPYYQYYFLDIFAFIFVALYLLHISVKTLLNILSRKVNTHKFKTF